MSPIACNTGTGRRRWWSFLLVYFRRPRCLTDRLPSAADVAGQPAKFGHHGAPRNSWRRQNGPSRANVRLRHMSVSRSLPRTSVPRLTAGWTISNLVTSSRRQVLPVTHIGLRPPPLAFTRGWRRPQSFLAPDTQVCAISTVSKLQCPRYILGFDLSLFGVNLLL